MEIRTLSRIETLVKKNLVQGSQRWKPTFVSEFEQALGQGSFRGMNNVLRKNIIYSLQYLQYIQLQLDEMHHGFVVERQLWKSYIVISMGIIEGVFYHLLKSSGNQAKTTWEEILRVSTNPYIDEGNVRKKNDIITYRELLSAKDARMDFESMIQKVRSKHLLKLPQAAYPYIKELKCIRNKVHLFVCKDDYDTDFSGITETDYRLARFVLYRVLTDKVFSPDLCGNTFDWLKQSTEILVSMTDTLKKRMKKNEKE